MNLKKKHGMILSVAIQTCKLPKLVLRMCPRIQFWSINEQHPDSVSCLHIQTRLMGNFSLNGGIPWLCNTDGAICFLCKADIETVSHCLLDCPNFREHFDSLWANLTVKVKKFNDIDGRQISEFIAKLDRHQKALLLLGCVPLPFDTATVTMITRFITAAVGKIYNLLAERLRGLEAPWLSHQSIAYLTLFRFCNFLAIIRFSCTF